MSLHDLANHVQSAGRGEDKVLVHMTPGEVSGLQSLAMAHGGSLTINPETGLPEAGFLSSLLPMAIGFGLAPFTGGLSAALITGAGYTAATGSLKKGIMAGLGAYGGAGLAQGLSSMGAQAAGAGAGTGAGVSNAAATANSQIGNVIGGSGVTPVVSPWAGTPNFATNASTLASSTPVTTAYNWAGSPTIAASANPAAATTAKTATSALSPDAAAALKGGPYPYDIAAQTSAPISRPFTDYMSQVGQGAKNVYAGGTEGLKALYSAMPNYSVTAGLTGTAGTYLTEKQEKAEEEMRKRRDAQDEGLIRPYTFDYGATNVAAEPYSGSAERTHFQSAYTAGEPYKAPGPEYAAGGGLMSLAVGGPVEDMAAMNSVGANTGYPMAALQTPVYSNPAMQRPEAMNVIAPSADAGVGSYSGEVRFAMGGPSTKEGSGNVTAFGKGSVSPNAQSSGYTYDYNPSTMQFTQTGGPGASKMPTGKELAEGVGAHDMLKRFNEHILTGKPYNSTPSFMSGATPNGTVSGGVTAPIMQPAAPAQSFVPNIDVPAYQTPEQQLGLTNFYDYMNQQLGGYGGYAAGGGVRGESHLGDYSDGGRLLKGPGDGVSDSIPASIGGRQPARLADGEFVIPARIVSEIGNGSTEAGARKLYAMMDRVQRARRKTVGKNQVAKNTKAEKLLPA